MAARSLSHLRWTRGRRPTCSAAAAVLLGGVSLGAFVLYRLITVFFTSLTHADVALPAWLDRALSWVVVTPAMHKFHHHDERPWTDGNYGSVLSVWGRLFGTFVYGDARVVRYGLDSLGGEAAEVLCHLLLPFRRGRGRS